ncbi:hypothetical protein SDC9_110259 [bioreactor metagenome]|uniref:Uncharacterized protein n=1 Tax=bioreactor metagenome TaxID=1076179 RepID=A0A645BD19_9ZZZZ
MDGGDSRRGLHAPAHEAAEFRVDKFVGYMLPGRARRDLAFGVVRRGGGAEGDLGLVPLGQLHDEVGEARGLSGKHQQKAGGRRIKSAPVPGLYTSAEDAAYLLHTVGTSESRRFIERKDSRKRHTSQPLFSPTQAFHRGRRIFLRRRRSRGRRRQTPRQVRGRCRERGSSH